MVLSTLFFHTDIMCKDGSVIPGGEWPSVDWMTDTPLLGQLPGTCLGLL